MGEKKKEIILPFPLVAANWWLPLSVILRYPHNICLLQASGHAKAENWQSDESLPCIMNKMEKVMD